MGDAAIGTITMSSYSNELDNPINSAFVKAWHEAYGPDNYPDFKSAAGWDMMQAIFDTVKKLDGKFGDGEKVMVALQGLDRRRTARQGRDRSADARHHAGRACASTCSAP